MTEQAIIERAEITAFARLAHTLSRISVQKTMWARTAKQLGMHDKADHFFAEAARFRSDANWYLRKAQDRYHG